MKGPVAPLKGEQTDCGWNENWPCLLDTVHLDILCCTALERSALGTRANAFNGKTVSYWGLTGQIGRLLKRDAGGPS